MKSNIPINLPSHASAMIKSVYLVGILTGLGYLASTIFSFLLVRMTSDAVVQEIAIIESIIITIISITAFGVQPHATRAIATKEIWQHDFRAAQASKLTAGILIALIFLALHVAGFGKIYLYLTLTPLFSIGIEYALYALGHPVLASIVSFLKNGSTYLILIIIIFVSPNSVDARTFIIILSLGTLLSLYLGRHLLKTPVLAPVSISALSGYLTYFKIGAGSFFIEYIRPLALLIGGLYLSASDLEIYYPILKFYLLYIGIRRLVVGALYKEIQNKSRALLIDRFFIAAGFFSLLILFIADSFIAQILFSSNQELASNLIALSGLCIFGSSFFLTSGPRIQIAGLDNDFFFANLSAFVVFIITTCFVVYFGASPTLFLGCLFLGELTSAILLKLVTLKKIVDI